jgi:hypothetical protein
MDELRNNSRNEPEVGDRFRMASHGRTITVIDRPDPGTVIYAIGRVSRYSIGQAVRIDEWHKLVSAYWPLLGKSGSVPQMVLHVQRHPSEDGG